MTKAQQEANIARFIKKCLYTSDGEKQKVFQFGKYCDKKIVDIIEEDRGYIEYCIKEYPGFKDILPISYFN